MQCTDHPCHQSLLEFRPLVAAVGIEFEQKRIQAEQRAHQQHTAVAVLDVGRMDDGLQQQSLGVYQDMAFLALDLLASVKTSPVDRKPPLYGASRVKLILCDVVLSR
jgi:hypothetical protein